MLALIPVGLALRARFGAGGARQDLMAAGFGLRRPVGGAPDGVEPRAR
jgi:hypothetical protein